MTKKEFIASRFDIEGLKELGVLTTEKTYEEIEKRICRFFGLTNIFMYDFILKEQIKPVKANPDFFSNN